MTLKQRLFVQKYLESGNATQAALEIYNAKYNSASVIGSRLLRNIKVKQEIDAVLEANMSFLAYIALLLKRAIESNSGREQIKAIEIALRLKGLL